MDKLELARIIRDALTERDDVTTADVIGEDGPYTTTPTVGVEMDEGTSFFVEVHDA
jgi:hypothetical protein